MLNVFNGFRQLAAFINNPLFFIEQQHQTQGDFFSLRLGFKSIHFACHPRYAEALLGVNADRFQKSRLIFDKIRPITGRRGLVQLEGDEWTRMRKITNEIFQRQYMAQYPAMMNHYADWISQQIAPCSSINISSLMLSYTLKTALNIIFGEIEETDVKLFAALFIELNARCGYRMRSLLNWPSFSIYRIQKSLRKRVMELISKQEERGLVAVLLSQFPLHDNKMADLIVDQLMTFLFAGFETTAASLTSSFYLLAKYPELQEKIILDDKKKTYTIAVYKEALRLYPPAWMLARQAVTDTMLGDQFIRKGDNIFLSVREIHRHKEEWEKPDACMPERFLLDETTFRIYSLWHG